MEPQFHLEGRYEIIEDELFGASNEVSKLSTYHILQDGKWYFEITLVTTKLGLVERDMNFVKFGWRIQKPEGYDFYEAWIQAGRCFAWKNNQQGEFLFNYAHNKFAGTAATTFGTILDLEKGTIAFCTKDRAGVKTVTSSENISAPAGAQMVIWVHSTVRGLSVNIGHKPFACPPGATDILPLNTAPLLRPLPKPLPKDHSLVLHPSSIKVFSDVKKLYCGCEVKRTDQSQCYNKTGTLVTATAVATLGKRWYCELRILQNSASSREGIAFGVAENTFHLHHLQRLSQSGFVASYSGGSVYVQGQDAIAASGVGSKEEWEPLEFIGCEIAVENQNEFTVRWFRNGAPVLSDAITVRKRVPESQVVAVIQLAPRTRAELNLGQRHFRFPPAEGIHPLGASDELAVLKPLPISSECMTCQMELVQQSNFARFHCAHCNEKLFRVCYYHIDAVEHFHNDSHLFLCWERTDEPQPKVPTAQLLPAIPHYETLRPCLSLEQPYECSICRTKPILGTVYLSGSSELVQLCERCYFAYPMTVTDRRFHPFLRLPSALLLLRDNWNGMVKPAPPVFDSFAPAKYIDPVENVRIRETQEQRPAIPVTVEPSAITSTTSTKLRLAPNSNSNRTFSALTEDSVYSTTALSDLEEPVAGYTEGYTAFVDTESDKPRSSEPSAYATPSIGTSGNAYQQAPRLDQPANIYAGEVKPTENPYSAQPSLITLPSVSTTTKQPQLIVEDVRDRDWNEEFQQLVELPQCTASERQTRLQRLRTLADEFKDVATRVARRIVSEVHLAPNDRTIKAVDVGGIAGGSKYVVGGMFFKFALDLHGVYGGQALAMRSASHELNGLRAYWRCGVAGLSLPLLIVIDYLGHRVIATSLLPITKNSLRYGSSDGGRTVLAVDPKLNALMAEAGKRINLKPHICGIGSQKVELVAPTDIEAHIGRDGRYYVLDTARVFPPEKPWKTITGVITYPGNRKHLWGQITHASYKEIEFSGRDWQSQVTALVSSLQQKLSVGDDLMYCSKDGNINELASALAGHLIRGVSVVMFSFGVSGKVLYCLLRPELVSQLPKPLSSDAWSAFGRDNSAEHDREITEVTADILSKYIPAFCAKVNSFRLAITTAERLRTEMHAHGINMRFLSQVRAMVNISSLKSLIFASMITRAVKGSLRDKMRQAHNESECINIVISYLRELLRRDREGSHEQWKCVSHEWTRVELLLIGKYAKYGAADAAELSRVQDEVRMQHLILDAVARTMGVRWSDSYLRVLHFPLEDKHTNGWFALPTKEDVLELLPECRVALDLSTEARAILRSETANSDSDEAHMRLCKQLTPADVPVTLLRITQRQLREHQVDPAESTLKRFMEVTGGRISLTLAAAYWERLAEVARQRNDLDSEYQWLCAAVLVLLALEGRKVLDDQIDHPAAILLVNKLTINTIKNYRNYFSFVYARIFYGLWQKHPFPGDGEAATIVFGATFPVPLAKLLHCCTRNPGSNFPQSSSDLGQLPISDSTVQSWIEFGDLLSNSEDDSLCSIPLFREFVERRSSCGTIEDHWQSYATRDNLFWRFAADEDDLIVSRKGSTFNLLAAGTDLVLDVLNSANRNYFVQIAQVSGATSSQLRTLQAVVLPGRQQLVIPAKDLTLPENANSIEYKLTFPRAVGTVPSATYGGESVIVMRNIPQSVAHKCYLNLDSTPIPLVDAVLGAATGYGVAFVWTESDVYVWGMNNTSGQQCTDKELPAAGLDDPPVLIPAFKNRKISKIAVGGGKSVRTGYLHSEVLVQHCLALNSLGEVYSWGAGRHGELGYGSTMPTAPVPRLIESLAHVKIADIAAGRGFSLALSRDGDLYGWGSAYSNGLGKDSLTPVKITSFEGRKSAPKFRAVCAGFEFAAALTLSGRVWLWGRLPLGSDDIEPDIDHELSRSEALEIGRATSEEDPAVEVPQPRQLDANLFGSHFVIQIAAAPVSGARHMLCLTNEGKVLSFGRGDRGQLGFDGFRSVHTMVSNQPPALVAALSDEVVVKIACGGSASFAITKEGRLYFWGHTVCIPHRIATLGTVPVFDAVASGTVLSMHSMRIVISGHAPPVPFLDVIPSPDEGDIEVQRIFGDEAAIAPNSTMLSVEDTVPAPRSSDSTMALARVLLLYAMILVRAVRQHPSRKSIDPARSPANWMDFHSAAGFSKEIAQRYSEVFLAQEVRLTDLDELNADYLQRMGITLVGHQMMILKHRNSLYKV